MKRFFFLSAFLYFLSNLSCRVIRKLLTNSSSLKYQLSKHLSHKNLLVILHTMEVLLSKYYYFVSEAQRFKNYFFCCFLGFFLWFFSNLQNSMVLTIFLHTMDGLLIKYDIMMIFFSGFFSVFRTFSGFFRISLKSSDLFSERVVYCSQIIWLFSFPVFSGFFWFFPGFSGFSSNILIHSVS